MKLSFYVTPDGKLPEGIKETLKLVISTLAGKKVFLIIRESGESDDVNAEPTTFI